jgi:hypothetical protein
VTWTTGHPVSVAFSLDHRTVAVAAGAVLVHEPTERVYGGLPLATFTPPMRRFWRRVFRVVRIPGGRLLLGWLSRRTRGPV